MVKNTIFNIIFEKETKTFHLFNEAISYIIKIDKFGKLLHLYYGEKISHRRNYDHFIQQANRPMLLNVTNEGTYSYEQLKQEFPEYGTTDFKNPSLKLRQENGSYVTNFYYLKHTITYGKPNLDQLPHCYVSEENKLDAMSLSIELLDQVNGVVVQLNYSIFKKLSVITKSINLKNTGNLSVYIERLMSVNLDLPDSQYDMIHLTGAWGRERHVTSQDLKMGTYSFGSTRGHSSHMHNPFVALKRKKTDEFNGQVIASSLIYSGNFLTEVEVDAYDTSRLQMGMHPETFNWRLKPFESFQSPEAVLVFSNQGMNGMSQTFHRLINEHIVRGPWKKKNRPILLNNWEATYFDFNEKNLLALAENAAQVGIELFVLDDGWFGKRTNDRKGLGDWVVNHDKLKNGISGLSEKINNLGLDFGLWIEPEMVNEESELYKRHPEWIIQTPNRKKSSGRHQYVLNLSKLVVRDYLFDCLSKVIISGNVSYIKWDMNRSMSEVYDSELVSEEQGEFYHRYILGVYNLHQRLLSTFPELLIEGCASGGGRFDMGMLYYTPQIWTSDDTDSYERLKIQYGTSYIYPISSMGSHVSIVPNHQVNRCTSLHTRAAVSYFGTFGYELDLTILTPEELTEIKAEIIFFKKNRKLFQYGTFYRIMSPFEGDFTSWMVVDASKRKAVVGWYKGLDKVNSAFNQLKLKGLDKTLRYQIEGQSITYFGDELMNVGLMIDDPSNSQIDINEKGNISGDFDSRLWVLEALDE